MRSEFDGSTNPLFPLYRSDAIPRAVRAFADGLRGAWARVKKLAMAAAKMVTRASGARLNFSPFPIRSPAAHWI